MKSGIFINKTCVKFSDDSKRTFNITLCGIPFKYDISAILEVFEKFSKLDNYHYSKVKTSKKSTIMET